MDDFLRKMGTRILVRRKELGLTQETVAEFTGLTVQTISSAERGTKALRPENIVKVSMVLDVTPDFLLLGKNKQDSLGDLVDGIEQLTSRQKYYLKQIVENYIAGLSTTE